MEVQLQAVMFAVAATVIGLVIFGGTTLAYFMGKRGSRQERSGVPSPAPTPTQQAPSTGRDEVEASRRAA